jgi:hypothetical protein
MINLGVTVSNAKGALFNVFMFSIKTHLQYHLKPLDDYSRKVISTGGGYLDVSEKHFSEQFFVVAMNNGGADD